MHSPIFHLKNKQEHFLSPPQKGSKLASNKSLVYSEISEVKPLPPYLPTNLPANLPLSQLEIKQISLKQSSVSSEASSPFNRGISNEYMEKTGERGYEDSPRQARDDHPIELDAESLVFFETQGKKQSDPIVFCLVAETGLNSLLLTSMMDHSVPGLQVLTSLLVAANIFLALSKAAESLDQVTSERSPDQDPNEKTPYFQKSNERRESEPPAAEIPEATPLFQKMKASSLEWVKVLRDRIQTSPGLRDWLKLTRDLAESNNDLIMGLSCLLPIIFGPVCKTTLLLGLVKLLEVARAIEIKAQAKAYVLTAFFGFLSVTSTIDIVSDSVDLRFLLAAATLWGKTLKLMEFELEQLKVGDSNYEALFNDSPHSQLICQQVGSRVKLLTTNKRFQSEFCFTNKNSQISRVLRQRLFQTQADKRISLQSLILTAKAGDKFILSASKAKQISRGIYQCEVVSSTFDHEQVLIVTLRDVGEVVKAKSSEMQEFYQEALTATISHEQLNPLNSIINLSTYMCDWFAERKSILQDYLDEEPGADVQASIEDLDSQAAVIKMIQSSSIMMHILNAAILNSRLINFNQYTFKRDSIDHPQAIVEKLLSVFEQQITQKGIQLELTKGWEGDQGAINAADFSGIVLDKALYEQVVFNILVNACKFNREQGGFIRIKFVALGCRSQPLTPSCPGTFRFMTVIEDNGVGMSQAKVNKIGKVFENIHARQSHLDTMSNTQESQAAATSGCGLGVSLSMQLVQKFNGSIKIQSQQGKGTKVEIITDARLGQRRTKTCLSQEFHPGQFSRRSSKNRTGSDKTVSWRSPVLPDLSTLSPLSAQLQRENRQNNPRFSFFKKRSSIISHHSITQKILKKRQSGLPRPSPSRNFAFVPSESELSSNLLQSAAPAITINENLYDGDEGFSPDIFIRNKNSAHGSAQIVPIEEQTEETYSIKSDKQSLLSRKITSQLLSQSSQFRGIKELSASKIDLHFDCLQSSRSDDHGPSFDQFFESTPKEGEKDTTKMPKFGQDITPVQSGFRLQSEDTPNSADSSSSEEGSLTSSESVDYNKDELVKILKKIKASGQTQQDKYLHNIKEDDLEDQTSMNPSTCRPSNQSEGSSKSKNRLMRKSLFGNGQSFKLIFQQSLDKDSSERKKSILLSQTPKILSEDQIQNLKKPQFVNRAIIRDNRLSIRKTSVMPCNCSPILVVDDNLFNIETLKIMIRQQFGVEAMTANNGAQAVAAFEARNKSKVKTCIESCRFPFVELVFMDLNMPVMDGFEATSQILKMQKEEGVRKCAVVALTAYQNKQSQQRCSEIGMKEVMNKPAKCEEIKRVVQKFCPLLKATH